MHYQVEHPHALSLLGWKWFVFNCVVVKRRCYELRNQFGGNQYIEKFNSILYCILGEGSALLLWSKVNMQTTKENMSNMGTTAKEGIDKVKASTQEKVFSKCVFFSYTKIASSRNFDTWSIYVHCKPVLRLKWICSMCS